MTKNDSAQSLALMKKFGIDNIKKLHARGKYQHKVRRNPPRGCRQNHPKNCPAKKLTFSDTRHHQRHNGSPQRSRKAQRRESRQAQK